MSLRNQTVRPHKIILNVSSEPFMLDKGIVFQDLPKAVREMTVSGDLEIYRVPNQGPYRKLLPTLRRFRGTDFLVATADDDVMYPTGWLATLVETFERNQSVVAYRCRKLVYAASGLLPYLRWPFADPAGISPENHLGELKSLDLLPTGRGGVLYHSRFFPDLPLLDELRKLAPGQDDLAFKWATLIRNIPVALADFRKAGASSLEFAGFHNAENLYFLNREKSNALTLNDNIWNSLARQCSSKHVPGVDFKQLTISIDGG